MRVIEEVREIADTVRSIIIRIHKRYNTNNYTEGFSFSRTMCSVCYNFKFFSIFILRIYNITLLSTS